MWWGQMAANWTVSRSTASQVMHMPKTSAVGMTWQLSQISASIHTHSARKVLGRWSSHVAPCTGLDAADTLQGLAITTEHHMMLTRSRCRYAEHLPEVFKHPDSDVPIPYTELLITGTPGYKKRDAGKIPGPFREPEVLQYTLRQLHSCPIRFVRHSLPKYGSGIDSGPVTCACLSGRP